MTAIKICGLQPGDDLSFTAHPRVAYAGIIFVPGSRRFVSPEKAVSITRAAAAICKILGVFVDEAVTDMVEIGHKLGLAGMQLHGSESVDVCESLKQEGFLVWKSFSMKLENFQGEEAISEKMLRYAPSVDGILLDAPPPDIALPKVTGGFGHSFDWASLPALLQGAVERMPPVWIAGGITPGNVHKLFSYWRPAGIDVSSGVEIKGRKSTQKIQELIKAVEFYA